MDKHTDLAIELRNYLFNGILKRWYPLVVDDEFGGYFTNISHDWKVSPQQNKMIVTQARHIWTLSKVSEFLKNDAEYLRMALHGLPFLKEVMWDQQYGGFYQIRSRDGEITDENGWLNEKRTYGNAFGLFALAALSRRTNDSNILAFAQSVFRWIEDHAFDRKNCGYYQFLTQAGSPFDAASVYKTIASDANELGLKDQNSSIHLLEAYTELFHAWKDPALCNQLRSLLELIRDTIVHRRGYLQLFFYPDWKPVSFRDCTKELREMNYGLDHVSFGHDYETAFLMLEASYALGLKNDQQTLIVAKKMMDHAIQNGWDKKAGGFFDGGYYLNGGDECTIIKETKNWWAQAEGLNALLLFSKIFPNEPHYYEYFTKLLEYVRCNVIDLKGGDWFEGGIDKEPFFKSGPKSHMWKCTYHTSRALMNCINILEGSTCTEIEKLIDHWKTTGVHKAA